MRIERAPRDHHVRLGLGEIEQLAERDHSAEPGDAPRAAKIEAGPDQHARRQRHSQRPAAEHRDRRDHQRPHAKPAQRSAQRGRRADQRRDDVDLRLAAKVHAARKDRVTQREERVGQEDQRLPAQHRRHYWLAIVVGDQRCCGELDKRQRAVEHDQHPEQLAQQPRRHLALLDQRAGQAIAVHQVEQAQHHRRHRVQTIVGRREDADDQEGRTPRD